MNTIATFFSGQDMLIIFLIVLLLFGAKKLPELAKGMGQAIREFNKAKDEVTREITKPVDELTVQPVAQQPQNPTATETPVQPAIPTQPTPPTTTV